MSRATITATNPDECRMAWDDIGEAIRIKPDYELGALLVQELRYDLFSDVLDTAAIGWATMAVLR